MSKGWNSLKGAKFETSKLLLWMLLSGLGLISVSAIIYSFFLQDSSPLIALIESISKLSTIAVGFYFWKAKAENLHKYKQDDKIGDIHEN